MGEGGGGRDILAIGIHKNEKNNKHRMAGNDKRFFKLFSSFQTFYGYTSAEK